LIEAVGENVKVPADARVIDGRGLIVYPGFFDTNTSLGSQRRDRVVRARINRTQTNAIADGSTAVELELSCGLQPEESAVEQSKSGRSAI
jgi:imidazolonepropionase-like amidohydrolase